MSWAPPGWVGGDSVVADAAFLRIGGGRNIGLAGDHTYSYERTGPIY